jgi:hypothetical protein
VDAEDPKEEQRSRSPVRLKVTVIIMTIMGTMTLSIMDIVTITMTLSVMGITTITLTIILTVMVLRRVFWRLSRISLELIICLPSAIEDILTP